MTILRSIRDLLAVVPYLLGFHPSDSVVLLALRGREVTFQVRADLPAPAEVPGLAERLAGVLARHGPTSALVIGYGTGAAVGPVVLAVQAALEAMDVAVLDVLRVADGRYWSYLCEEPACCPPEGRPYDPAASPVAAEAVVNGYVALPSRDELARRLDPVVGAERDAMTAATIRARERLLHLIGRGSTRSVSRAGRVAVDDAVRGRRAGAALPDDDLAWLTVLLVHTPVRDYAWDSVGGDLGTHVGLWTEVIRRAEPGLVVVPAALLSYAAWCAGEGAVAAIALSRAMAVDPDDPMVALMSRVLT